MNATLEDKNDLFIMIQKHLEYTGSTVAKFILDDLDNQLQHFVKVFPTDYKKVLAIRKSVSRLINKLPIIQKMIMTNGIAGTAGID